MEKENKIYQTFYDIEQEYIKYEKTNFIKDRIQYLTEILNYSPDEAKRIWKKYKQFLAEKIN